tara:strand:+ start:2070 stop:2231 length:162 start_codon:yes stop_codon:yes gene_type:complete
MSNLTLEELKERLALLDEITLLELLEVNSTNLLDAFEDIVEAKYDKLKYALID